MDLHYNRAYNQEYPPEPCKVTLQDEALWKKFHEVETEMIITKPGRRMFPSVRVKISELDPSAHYCLFLEFRPATNSRYRYSAATGWAPAGSEEAHSPNRMYVHPESPATGEHWMSQPVSFGRAKLTNSILPSTGRVVLSSMHKYQPRIIIVKSVDPRAIGWAPSLAVVFPETQFVAVTAYQNEDITRLKIDNNPFAKGFRDSALVRSKRKRTERREKPKLEEDVKIRDDSTESRSTLGADSLEDHLSVACSSCSRESDIVEPEPPATTVATTNFPNFYPFYNLPYQYKYPFMPPSYESYPYYFPPGLSYTVPWRSPYGFQTMPPPSYCNFVPYSQKPKQLTDFSIRAITGL